MEVPQTEPPPLTSEPALLPGLAQAEEVVHVPQYNVVLLDDNDHTYEYVIEMLARLFGHNLEKAYQMAVTVDRTGRVVVETTYRERAELKRDQIHRYGADWRISHSAGSMSAIIEPAGALA